MARQEKGRNTSSKPGIGRGGRPRWQIPDSSQLRRYAGAGRKWQAAQAVDAISMSVQKVAQTLAGGDCQRVERIVAQSRHRCAAINGRLDRRSQVTQSTSAPR